MLCPAVATVAIILTGANRSVVVDLISDNQRRGRLLPLSDARITETVNRFFTAAAAAAAAADAAITFVCRNRTDGGRNKADKEVPAGKTG